MMSLVTMTTTLLQKENEANEERTMLTSLATRDHRWNSRISSGALVWVLLVLVNNVTMEVAGDSFFKIYSERIVLRLVDNSFGW